MNTYTKLTGIAAIAVLAVSGFAYATNTITPQVKTIRVQATTGGTSAFAVVACPSNYPYLIGGGGAAVGAPLWWDAPYTSNPYWHYGGVNPGNAWMVGADYTADGMPPGYVTAFAICES